MRLIRPSFKVEGFYMDDPTAIERLGRICYKSEGKITSDSAEAFIKSRIGSHESVIEHSAMTVRFICDRGVTHELVRHRLCAFSQESTRYCNYRGGVTFIIPPWFNEINEGEYKTAIDNISSVTKVWFCSMLDAEGWYKVLLNAGQSPQQARSVLPNSTKTEIVMTANFREWRHIFKLRCANSAHPQMQEIMRPLLVKVKKLIPIIFDDILS